MKAITVCLLVIVSASCLLGTNANDYQEVEAFGFSDVLKAVLSTVNGVKCTIEEVIAVRNAAEKYIDDVENCNSEVPKNIQKIVKSCNKIITICDEIIHLNSKLCVQSDDSKMSPLRCSLELTTSLMKLTRQISKTLHLIAELPAETDACYRQACDELTFSICNFEKNVEKCKDA